MPTDARTYADAMYLAADVAVILGPDWSIVPHERDRYPHWGRVTRAGAPAGYMVNIMVRDHEKMIEVHGSYPVNAKGEQFHPNQRKQNSAPSINVGKGRSAEAIAAEIRRRFLPDYDAAFAECDARRKSWDDQRAAADATAARMAAIVGGTAQDGKVSEPYDYKVNQAVGSLGRCECHADSVYLEFSRLDADLAAEILRVYAKARAFAVAVRDDYMAARDAAGVAS